MDNIQEVVTDHLKAVQDEVLVNFSEEMDTEEDGSIYTQGTSNNVSNLYSSRDTIHMETF